MELKLGKVCWWSKSWGRCVGGVLLVEVCWKRVLGELVVPKIRSCLKLLRFHGCL